MASNKPTGDNARKGAVRKRSQVENTKTSLMIKRNKGKRSVYGRENVWG